MKDLIVGLAIGLCLGFCLWFSLDLAGNRAARADASQRLQNQQQQVDMLKQLCPEVMSKLQKAEQK